MYTNFKELHKAYGFDNPCKSREHLTEEEERTFVNDCYDTYEHIGFTETFDTPYTDKEKYKGMKFTVLGRVKEFSDNIKEGNDLECLPMWKIQFENGDIIEAYPEEICLEERKQLKQNFKGENIMNKKIYAVDLCYYTEENVPECGKTIFIRSDKDITKMPKHIIKENIFVEEEMENNDCEGIGYICEIAEEEFYEEYSEEYDLIEM